MECKQHPCIIAVNVKNVQHDALNEEVSEIA